jgi:hypothetical protein
MDQLPASATQEREEEEEGFVLLVDGDVGREVLGDGVYLPRGVAEVLVPVLSELPELRLMVFRIPDGGNMYVKTNAGISTIQFECSAAFFLQKNLYTCRRGPVPTSCSQCTPVASACAGRGWRRASLHILRHEGFWTGFCLL